MLKWLKYGVRLAGRGILWIIGIILVFWICNAIFYTGVEVGTRPNEHPDISKMVLPEPGRRTFLQADYITKYTRYIFNPNVIDIHAQFPTNGKYNTAPIQGIVSPRFVRDHALTRTPEQMVKWDKISLELAQQYHEALSHLILDESQGTIRNEWGDELWIQLNPDTSVIEIYIDYQKTPRFVCELSPRLICVQYWWEWFITRS